MKTVQSKFHHSTIRALGLGSLIAGACVCAQAQTIILGTSSSYAVLASTTITSTGTTILTGDLGLSPGTAVTGSPTVTGSSHINDPTAATARADATTAYNQLAALTATQSLTGDLGGSDRHADARRPQSSRTTFRFSNRQHAHHCHEFLDGSDQ